MSAAIDMRVTPSEAARAAGVSVDTVRGWVRAGILRAEHTPLGALIDARDLGQVIAGQVIAARDRRQRAASLARLRN